MANGVSRVPFELQKSAQSGACAGGRLCARLGQEPSVDERRDDQGRHDQDAGDDGQARNSAISVIGLVLAVTAEASTIV